METALRFSPMQFDEFIRFLSEIKNSDLRKIPANQLPYLDQDFIPTYVEITGKDVKVKFDHPVVLPDGKTGKVFEFMI